MDPHGDHGDDIPHDPIAAIPIAAVGDWLEDPYAEDLADPDADLEDDIEEDPEEDPDEDFEGVLAWAPEEFPDDIPEEILVDEDDVASMLSHESDTAVDWAGLVGQLQLEKEEIAQTLHQTQQELQETRDSLDNTRDLLIEAHESVVDSQGEAARAKAARKTAVYKASQIEEVNKMLRKQVDHLIALEAQGRHTATQQMEIMAQAADRSERLRDRDVTQMFEEFERLDVMLGGLGPGVRAELNGAMGRILKRRAE